MNESTPNEPIAPPVEPAPSPVEPCGPARQVLPNPDPDFDWDEIEAKLRAIEAEAEKWMGAKAVWIKKHVADLRNLL